MVYKFLIYRMLMIAHSLSGKTSTLLHSMKKLEDDNYSIIDKMYLYVKDPNEVKYQYLIKRHEKNDLENLKNPMAFSEYSNNMQYLFKKIEDYNPPGKVDVWIQSNLFKQHLYKMINHLRRPILSLPRQILIWSLLYKTTTFLTCPSTTFFVSQI